MKVVIDSSHKLLFTGMISGHDRQMDEFYAKFDRIYTENGLSHKYHWNELRRGKRDLVKKPMAAALGESEGIRFNVIEHRKPNGIEKNDWYFHQVPARMAQRMESWLMNKWGNLEIIIDNDYNVVAGGRGTEHLIEHLVMQIGFRITGDRVAVKSDWAVRSEIKQSNGENLRIMGYVAQKNSKWIELVDAYLGLYCYDSRLFRGLKNFYFMK